MCTQGEEEERRKRTEDNRNERIEKHALVSQNEKAKRTKRKGEGNTNTMSEMRWIHSSVLLLVLASALIICVSSKVSAPDMFMKRHNRKLLSDQLRPFRNGKDTLKYGLEIAAAAVLEAGSVELIDLAVEGSL